MTRSCKDCGAPVSPSSTGRCRSCGGRFSIHDPVHRERRLAALRLKVATPSHREKQRKARLRLQNQRRDDPAWIEMKRLNGVRLRAAYDADPEAQARNLAARSIASKKASDRHLPWCPRSWRPRYQALRSKHGADRARRLTLVEIAQAEMAALSVDAAVDFLRPFAPIYRCAADGKLATYGGFWRYGRTVLDRVGVIERAAQRGWPAAANLAAAMTGTRA